MDGVHLTSPFKSLVLEAVLTVIGGESAQASGSDPVQEITQLFPPSGPPRRYSHSYQSRVYRSFVFDNQI